MPRAIICTHHKTGTTWMARTFWTIAEATGAQVVVIKAKTPPTAVPPSSAIILDIHSAWRKPDFEPLHQATDRLLHVIRDPRDVVISAAHYHTRSSESWLHRPMEAFGGRTYQQAINAVPEGEDRLTFEMQNNSRRVIRHMLRWDYGRPDTIECTYEDLMADASCDLFGSVAVRLGLDEAVSRRCFWESSLFGGLADEAVRPPNHVRSGAGRQWEQVFNQPLARAFISLFGDALIRLGYEADHGWIDRLPERTSAPPGETVSA